MESTTQKEVRIQVDKLEVIQNSEIETNFTYHSPKPGQPEKYQLLREKAKELAYYIKGLSPSSREQSLAMTHLENAVMWANAAIARKGE